MQSSIGAGTSADRVRRPDARGGHEWVIDGVQLGAGCSVGKRNLTVTEGEKVGALFRSRSGKTVRIDLRPELPGKIAAWIEEEGVEATARRVLGVGQEEVFVIARLAPVL
jgi:hypothetical protein